MDLTRNGDVMQMQSGFPKQLFNNCVWAIPDSKAHGANMGPNWGRQDPGGPYIGPTNFAIWDG